MKQIGVLDKSIADLEKQIFQIEKGIKTIDDRIGIRSRNRKFIDLLREDIDSNMYGHLSYLSFISQDNKSKEYIKNYEAMRGVTVFNTEKFKLMKYLGQFSESLDDIFEIDHISFSFIQHHISKIRNSYVDEEENSFLKISRNITIKAYFPDLTNKHFENKLYEIGDNEKTYEIQIIEFNEFYFINRKLNIMEIKLIACRYWELNHELYLMCDENLNIFPCDLIVYEEIFELNLEKGIKSHCKFYQLNPKIIVNCFLS